MKGTHEVVASGRRCCSRARPRRCCGDLAYGRVGMNGELVSVPRSTSNAIAPRAPAVDRGHERASLDRDPESTRFERVARDPANVMSLRSRRKRPFRRRGQCFQAAGVLPHSPSVRRAHTSLGSVPTHTRSRSTGLAAMAMISRPARPTDRQDCPPSSVLNTPSRWVPHHARP